MKKILSAAAITMAVGLGLNGATHAQISQSGPYYSTPAWDQQLPASSRWIVLTNWGSAAVLDRETGLVWQQSPGTTGKKTWAAAIQDCLEQSTGGRNGWRLPSAEEAMTLLDPANGNLLFVGSPFSIPAGPFVQFWTTTTDSTDTARAYNILISTAFGAGLNSSGKVAAVNDWCVRGYQGTQSPQ